MFNKKGQKGFTLIELLLVVAIIGILAAVALPKFNPDQTNAKIAKIKANLDAIETAAELYRVKNDDYPGATSGEDEPTKANVEALVSDYLKRMPALTDKAPKGSEYRLDPDDGKAYYFDGTGSFSLDTTDWSTVELVAAE